MKRRWHNIFQKDNRSFVLAMDHAELMDVSEYGLQSPAYVINEALIGGADAILTTYGVAKNFHDEIGNAGLILRIDGGTTQAHPSGYIMDKTKQIFSVEDAVKAGADGVMCMGFTGLENEVEMIENIAHIASECDKWGLVFGAEMIPGGFIKDDQKTIKNIKFANRLGSELGADFIKSPYIGGNNCFKEVIDNCYKPVLILGGGSSRNDKEILTLVREAMDSGTSGVVIGRNIWQHKKIRKICCAISSIIHENKTVEEAITLL